MAQKKDDQLQDVLGTVFHKNNPAASLIDIYAKYYDLPRLAKQEEVPIALFYYYSRRRNNFVVVAIYNERGEFLLINNFDRQGGWELLGGGIKDNETVDEALNRIVEQQTKLSLDQVEPIAVIENIFTCGSQEILHRGLAFLAHTRDKPVVSGESQVATFVSIGRKRLRRELLFVNQEVLDLAHKKIQLFEAFAPDSEIDTTRHLKRRYWFHHTFVSPALSWFSSRLIKKKIKHYCQGAQTILDIACGDDSLVVELAGEVQLCFANDISRDIQTILQGRKSPPNLIFTHHDATNLPFKYKFDVTICKNTLHHMRDATDFKNLIDSLRRVSKRVIIIDIEDPTRSTKLAYFWNRYYVNFLGDQGGFFLKKDEFEKALTVAFASEALQFDAVRTIKGNYLFCIVDFG